MIRMSFRRPTILFVRILCTSALAVLPLFPALAEKEAISREQSEALVSGLKYQQGEIALQNGLATLRVPDGFRFLNKSDAQTVLVKLWGNPPSSDPLGMLMPVEVSPLSAESWAVVLTYEPDGYVSDKDAEKINYTELLAQMQKDMISANEERRKGGYEPIHLVGWAKAPRYDSQTHKLYWAKELKFGSQPENTLNYNIRMLGRGGVLVLNGVAAMSQLPDIEQATPKILGAIDFNPGHRYADFNPKSDKIASYGLAALVAGGAAATAVKLGLFKGLWLAILAAKKFIIIGVVAILASFRKLFKRREPTA
jgi:uncharacterized membrane-anchored protein